MVKLDKVLRTQFLINSEPVYTCDPKEILQEIFLSVPDIVYWSSEAIREFIIGTFEMINEFGMKVKEELKLSNSVVTGEVSKSFSRFSSWTKKTYRFIPKDRDKLILFVYNSIMVCEGKGLLAGFGMSNKHKDSLPGNPEKTTICALPVEIPTRKEKDNGAMG